MAWLNALHLHIGEVVVDSWEGVREVIGETPRITLDKESKNEKKVTVKEKKEGLLVLTNQRLLFLEAIGLNGREIGESVKVSLIDVGDMWFKKAPIKETTEVEGFETYYFRLKRIGKKKQFEAFKKQVEDFCARRKEEYEKETKKPVRLRVS